jgi:hypothetical protein
LLTVVEASGRPTLARLLVTPNPVFFAEAVDLADVDERVAVPPDPPQSFPDGINRPAGRP